jgi:iron(III) transport system ATP-binding protein
MLRVRGLKKTYKSAREVFQAVNDVSFDVAEGQFYTLLGPSGCGKTTTLQCIAGLETPDEGQIELGGRLVFSADQKVDLPAHKRDTGMVFQSYAIWPHMTVYENVAYPLAHGRRKTSKADLRERVTDALKLVELESFADRPAPFLSGGQQQRVALARALVDRPRVLLLDEPLSNLDAKMREGMRVELRRLIERLHITTIYVTHDQIEALTMSDRVAVMAGGKIVQEATPRQIYTAPATRFVASFVGKVNFLDALVIGKTQDEDGWLLSTKAGNLFCGRSMELREGERVHAAIRPESIAVHESAAAARARSSNVLSGTIASSAFYGEYIEYQIEVGREILQARSDGYIELEAGDAVYLTVPASRIVVFRIEDDEDKGERARSVEVTTQEK